MRPVNGFLGFAGQLLQQLQGRRQLDATANIGIGTFESEPYAVFQGVILLGQGVQALQFCKGIGPTPLSLQRPENALRAIPAEKSERQVSQGLRRLVRFSEIRFRLNKFLLLVPGDGHVPVEARMDLQDS